MTRVTRSEVEAVFARLCRALDIPNCEEMPDRYIDERASAGDAMEGKIHHKRGWSLDNAPAYGGYVIASHSGEGTGENRPLGYARMPARQFVEAMHFAIRTIAHKEL